MDSNTTSVSVEPVHGMTIRHHPVKLWAMTFVMGAIIMLTAAIIFGIVSWIKLTAWRQFKNFIFLNTTVTLFLMNISYIGCFPRWPCCSYKIQLLNELSMSALANWTLVMCMVIYTKIFKVFSGDLQHKYAKANAFAWGLAFLECGVARLHYDNPLPTVLCITHSMSYVVLGFYLSVDYALLKLAIVRTVSKDNTIQIIKIFFYVTSTCVILTLLQVKEYFCDYRDEIYLAIHVSQQILIFSFLTMKKHRELWREYLKTEAGQRDVIRTLI